MTAAQLKAALPALRSVTDAAVEEKIRLADPWFDETVWGDFITEGMANWVANELVLDEVSLSGADGLETSHSVGDTSFSLHPELVLRQAEDRSMRSRYGQRYRQLANLVGMGGVFQ